MRCSPSGRRQRWCPTL